ncbi:MAG: hypothetical protein ACR2IE_11040 [Candidatus Sumerlaeaceae bacterium]
MQIIAKNTGFNCFEAPVPLFLFPLFLLFQIHRLAVLPVLDKYEIMKNSLECPGA